MKTINKLFMCLACTLSLNASISCKRESNKIQILMTSDIHGMLVPFDYATDAETKYSLSQIGTAINELRNDNTLVIDCGDAIQGNYADMFVDKTKDVTHPMIEALNKLNYDVFVTGNHEYNFGMDYLQKQIKHFNGTVLTGNVVKKETYEPLADSYKIFNKSGVKVAVIGMTSPLITRWDGDKLKDWIVTDPINETKKVVKMLKENDLADVIIAAEHLGFPKENDAEGTSCRDLAEACPDIDVILASHEHKAYEQEIVNGVLICENASDAKTMMKVDLEIGKKDKNTTGVINKSSKKIDVSQYNTNANIDEFAKPYDEKAKENARTEIGTLAGDIKQDADWMSPKYEIESVPSTFMNPTPLVEIVNKVQMEYAKKDTTISEEIRNKIKVSSTAIGNYQANLKPGKIRKCDCSNIYKYANTLYVLEMNGKQLKQYMEWAAQFYNKFIYNVESQDLTQRHLTISFNDKFNLFNYDMFYGVDYEININSNAEKRIQNVKWSDTKEEVNDNEVFCIVVNNYRANTQLLVKGKDAPIYKEEDTAPTLKGSDLCGSQGIREMLADHIKNECETRQEKSIKASEYNTNNWSIVHDKWDEKNRNKAVDKIKKNPSIIGKQNTITITEADI